MHAGLCRPLLSNPFNPNSQLRPASSHRPQQPPGKGQGTHMHHPVMMHHPGGIGGGGGSGGGGGGGRGAGAMVPVPGPPMDEKQVKRAELVESPTTRLAFKVGLVCGNLGVFGVRLVPGDGESDGWTGPNAPAMYRLRVWSCLIATHLPCSCEKIENRSNTIGSGLGPSFIAS